MILTKKLLSILILFLLSLDPVLVSAIEFENPLGYDTFQELIYAIIDFLFNLSIPLASLMILVAGFYYITAAGKPERIQTAHKIILWTLIGFLIILSAKGTIWFLMEKVFKQTP